MQQRRRISTSGLATRARTNPVLATLLVVTLIATAAFGGNQVLQTQGLGSGPVEVSTTSASLSAGESVVVDDAAIATQGEGDAARTVKEFSQEEPFSMFALTWYGAADIPAYVRAERPDGSWSEWYESEPLNMAGADGKTGTELIFIEPTTRIQVNVGNVDVVSGAQAAEAPAEAAPAQAVAGLPEGIGGPEVPLNETPNETAAEPAAEPVPEEAPAQDLEIVSEEPVANEPPSNGLAPLPSNYGDIAPVAETDGPVTAENIDVVLIDGGEGLSTGGINNVVDASNTSGMPEVISRNGWSANEGIRCGSPTYTEPVDAVTVHHTAGSNNYSEAQAPGIVRGIYNYHASTLGWCDVGYGAMVDKYGNIYEGRAGGLDRAVQGAHVGGFNANTWGISMLGNYETATPTQEALQAMGEMAGWKAAVHDFEPNGQSYHQAEFTFSGSRYSAGQGKMFPNINAHRDFHYNACPGGNLYAQMGTIRSIADERYNAINAGQVTDSTSPTSTTPTTSNSNSGGNDESDSTVTTPREPNPSPGQNGGIPSDLGNTLAQASSGDSSALLALGLSIGVVVLVLALENDMVPLPGEADSVGEIEVFETLTVSDVARFADQLSALSSDSELSQEYQALSELVGPVLGANVTGGISTGIGGPTGDLVTEQTGSPELGSLADALSSQATKDLTFAIFENGFLLDSEEVGNRAIWGEIANAWLQQGLDLGPLGLPINDQYATGEGSKVRVDFQGGYISYDPATAQVDVQTS